ncbi:hypothetical protein CXB77_11435 [Chromatium okenii]|uniref:Uncharacterized protein n=1 Tax=Chromatium okenii TaxID=61644 RepID=A0A2S7XRJ1_9GAMM|nr:hypothetical protein CXB77_11435 [Chromatium okenii]
MAVNTDSTSLSLPTSNNELVGQSDSKPLFPVEDVMRGLTSKLTQEGVSKRLKQQFMQLLRLLKIGFPV